MSRRTNGALVGLLAVLLAAGCASTQATTTMQYAGPVPKPDRIVVYRFATTPEEVQLDRSPTAVTWKLQGISASTERQDVARKVSAKLADSLVQKIRALGLPAELGEGPPPLGEGSVLVVDGHFLAIDEGSRAERVTIGLGAGRSNVRTSVQVVEVRPEGRRVVDQFDVDAKSGRKPGMAETMGVGAAAGHLATSAAVSAAGAVGTEAFGTNVESDAERTAAKIAKMLENFFAERGWIAAPAGG